MYISFVLLSSWFCLVTGFIDYNKGNQDITSMLNYSIPWDTIKVSFSDNALTHVPAGYFKNLTNLEGIFLSRNLISDVDDFSFVAVPSVETIYLNDNHLSVIRENMLAGLFKLKTLSLSDNQIHTVEHRSFKDTPVLTNVNLNSNLLQNLSECIMFGPLNTTTLGIFAMTNNPLQCDYSWCWLKKADGDWVYVNYPQGTFCAGPGALSGQSWDTITTLHLNCDVPGGSQYNFPCTCAGQYQHTSPLTNIYPSKPLTKLISMIHMYKC